MGKCERCGGDIGIVPTICWKCFYSFWKTTTPEQAELIKEIQNEAVDNFAKKVKEGVKESYLYRHLDSRQEDVLFAIIDNALKQQNEGEE